MEDNVKKILERVKPYIDMIEGMIEGINDYFSKNEVLHRKDYVDFITKYFGKK